MPQSISGGIIRTPQRLSICGTDVAPVAPPLPRGIEGVAILRGGSDNVSGSAFDGMEAAWTATSSSVNSLNIFKFP